MRIALESPDQPQVLRLVDALDDYQRPLYPPESHHGIDIDALARPDVLFAVARDDAGDAVGCGAIVLTEAYGEIKRMYVIPSWRGRGVARDLLVFLETEAAARGCRRFALETGVRQAEALALYARMGYVGCAPFGPYTEDPHSVFMHKDLA
jgi:putative acetyltransferase